jgi:long-chain acyl-CoA synthetase
MASRSESRTFVANPADLPRGTLVELLYESAERLGDATAFLRQGAGGEWAPVSHRRFLAEVQALGLALESLGLARGDRIAILSENRYEWALADFASLCLGAPDVPIYPTLPANQIRYVLADSETRAIFVSTAEQLEKVREIRAELPALEHVIAFDPVAGDGGVLELDELLERGRGLLNPETERGFRERARSAQPDDLATLIYTSGTTGEPKGVMLTHNNIHSNTRAVDRVLEIGTTDVALSFLPLSHIFERMVDYYLFSKGCAIAHVKLLENVAVGFQEVRPTIAAGAPRVYDKIYNKVMSATGLKQKIVRWARAVGMRWGEAKLAGTAPGAGTALQHRLADKLVFSKLRARTGGRIRYFISGSAPLNPEVALFFYAAGLPILEGYGLTETSPVTNVNTATELRLGTVGKPIPGTEIRIAEDGEILVRGPQVMKGYYKKPEETAAVLEPDGWFHTGDIGEIDADGYLRITDRKKDLIVTAGGKNIAPQPIENLAKTNPFVGEAVLLGDRRPFPVLLVVPNYETLTVWGATAGIGPATQAELVQDDRVREKIEAEVFRTLDGLARYEMPKKIALIEREFSIERGELTPTMKVKRRVIESSYAELIEGLYERPAVTES